jgi:hypothetical protein
MPAVRRTSTIDVPVSAGVKTKMTFPSINLDFLERLEVLMFESSTTDHAAPEQEERLVEVCPGVRSGSAIVATDAANSTSVRRPTCAGEPAPVFADSMRDSRGAAAGPEASRCS